MLFKEIIAVYTDNRRNPYIQNPALHIDKITETYNYH
jgi:hypothetical protein